MNIKDLKEWLNTLPPDMDEFDISSAVGKLPATAKRIVAYKYKDGSGGGLVVNSMGTHLSDRFYGSVNIIGILDKL